jgi:hypothetical protein
VRLVRTGFLVALLAAVFVPAAAALDFNDEAEEAPPGEVGMIYHFEMPSHAGCPPYHYVVESGSLPPGLKVGNLNNNAGLVDGVPTAGGVFNAWIALKDVCGNSAELLFTFEIRARRFAITTTALPSAVAGSPYSAKLQATTVTADGFEATNHWKVTGGALPAGLTLADDGTIAGTAAATGTSSFTVTATAVGRFEGQWIDSKEFTLAVRDPLAASLSRRVAEVGIPFRAALAATGGQGPYTFTAVAALPDGLALDPAGVLSGVATTAGAFPLTIHLVDAGGASRDVNVRLDVRARLSIRSKRLRAAVVGRPYRAQLTVSGGVRAFTWRIAAGALPPGLRLDRQAGTLVGTPTAAGRFRVRIGVRDALGALSTRTFLVSVRR